MVKNHVKTVDLMVHHIDLTLVCSDSGTEEKVQRAGLLGRNHFKMDLDLDLN